MRPKSTLSASNRKGASRKPQKPYPDFPLTPHPSGRWCKKIRGQLHYFGPWSDPDAALRKYLDQRDDLHAGRKPRVIGDGLTVAELCNRYLNAKKHLLDTGEIKGRTFYEYRWTCVKIVEAFGRNRLVTDLTADDFEKLRATLAKVRGPAGLGAEINRVRMTFRYARTQGLIDRDVPFGSGFRRPSRKVLRQVRAAKGLRMFEAAELRGILDACGPTMRAMVLLGANCAFGAADISALPLSAVDLSRGWVNFPRPKTGVPRRCPLWPETVAALRQVVEARQEPKEAADESLVFLTTHGRCWVRLNQTGTPNDEIGKSFAKLLKALDLKRPGLSFYGLRHGFRTVGDESGDQIATNAIMGHVDDSMADLYRERISDARLQAVVDHVRAWLFPQVTKSEKATGRRRKQATNPAKLPDPDAGDSHSHGDRPPPRGGQQ